MKGVVLAAGRGERLRPLTDRLPKPLVPICGRACIEPLLEWLAAAGITAVGLNTHHLPECLERHLGDGAAWGVRLTWQHEPELLDGCGTLKSFEAFLGDDLVVMVNGDIVLDFELGPILATHRRLGAAMTLAMSPCVGPMPHPVAWDDTGLLRGIRRTGLDDPAGRHLGIFTGVHLIEPEIWRRHVPRGRPYHLSKDLVPRLLRLGVPVGCHLIDGLWADIGSRASLDRAHVAVLAERSRRYLGQARERDHGVFAEPGAQVHGELRPPVFLGRHCRVETGAVVGPFSAVAPGAVVPAGTRHSHGLFGV